MSTPGIKDTIIEFEKRADTITVNVNVDITTLSIETIVENVKQIAGRNEKGVY